jgi:hypothetical protein
VRAAPISVEVSGNGTGRADAAIARMGGTDLAVVTTREREADHGTLHVCDLARCRWSEGASPGGRPVDLIASTRDGLVAVTGETSGEAAVWYADDVTLTWRQLGSAPRGMRAATIQDGEGSAVLVWVDHDEDTFAVQTVGDGGLEDVVEDTPVEGGAGSVQTVLRDGDRWYLGGQRTSRARVSLGVEEAEPALWELTEDSWSPVDDELLRNQLEQGIEALLVHPRDGLRAVSSSPVLRVTMIWDLTRRQD